jgi:ferric-dicitrate binding protein FerR (iron transport regulator)
VAVVSDTVNRDVRRRRMNEQSMEWATRSKIPWTDEEEMIILNDWVLVDPSHRDELEISKRLQRSLFACQARAEALRDQLDIKDHTAHREDEPRYIGAADDPEDCWWSPGYYTEGK